MSQSRILAVAVMMLAILPTFASEPTLAYRVGVARIDITPDYPIRLAGFGFRRAESEGVTLPIHAKALCIDDGEPALLITAELCGVPARLTEDLAKRLAPLGIRRDRLALTVTHTHTAPMVKGYLPTLFGVPIPPDHQQHIDRYTAELLDKLESVSKAALADRKPARLSWGVGTVGFAINRRTKGGPTDHDLPVLAVHGADGKLRALYANYACHCVTLSNNKISGDWAGFAQQAIEADFPGATALISIGCGADQNPDSGVTGDKVERATVQGRALAAEIKRLANGYLTPIHGRLTSNLKQIDLPLADAPSRAAWEERAKQNGPDTKSYAIGYHAKAQLDRLDRGETLANKVNYAVQSWTFGDNLAMVFLPGEVVVDYSLRLKRELDRRRLWVNAYTNDVPCYIPSERILKEGGYEGGGAMMYYDLPGAFKPGLEQPIIDAVKQLVGNKYRSPVDGAKIGNKMPRSPQQSLAQIVVRAGMHVDLVAAEPLVTSPVAIDFAPDGSMWVCEMYDYPQGNDGQFKPAGRIRRLTSSRNDGRYDQATVFLDAIPFPTGVTVWRKGVLVCAAPDILYAEDTDNDGKADIVKKLYSGFGTDNYQARVNSLEYGLDGWVYGSCGLFGGAIKSFSGATLELGNRDFRIKPDTGEIEPATGRSQQGRVRDDWGNWFGCENSILAWHFPLPDHELRRNPHVPPPKPAVVLSPRGSADPLFPINPELQLFKLSAPRGLPTAVCGLCVYRDDYLGADVRGDLFVCEPVNQLVTRRRLEPKGSTFVTRRVPGEETSEFLASTDPWFRPVQAKTGPDGCLYIVDMYRYVIEHPRWIPPEELATVDVRAGSTMGRIYRVSPVDKPPRPTPQRNQMTVEQALDSPNGWQRDLTIQKLRWNNSKNSPQLKKIALSSDRPEARLSALSLLDSEHNPEFFKQMLCDSHPGVRRLAVEHIGRQIATLPGLGEMLLPLANDASPQVRMQVAFTLGYWNDLKSVPALLTLAERGRDDNYLTAAVLSSVNADNIAGMLDAIRQQTKRSSPRMLQGLLATAVAFDAREAARPLIDELIAPKTGPATASDMILLGSVMDALDRRQQTIETWAGDETDELLRSLILRAQRIALNDNIPAVDRIAAIGLLGRHRRSRTGDYSTLDRLLVPQQSASVQTAAAGALSRIVAEVAAARLIAAWTTASPSLRSQILDLVLSRNDWQRQLLEAIETNAVPAGEIDIPRRQRLLANPDSAARVRAEKLFAGSSRPDRQKLLHEYQDVLTMKTNADRGKTLFAKHCAACHRLNDVGHAVGPDLQALTNKTPGYMLQEILDPNRNVDSRHIEYRAVLADGRTLTGLLAAESATGITLRAQEGKEQIILRRDLEQLQGSGKSLMPENLESILTRQDLADVIAYVIGGR